MKRSLKISLILTAIIILMFVVGYNWYVSSMTENHVIEVENYRIDLSIKMDETFLDAQDDYSFNFSIKSEPNEKVNLEIDDCLSRCWIISKNENSTNQILLHGCDMNSELVYLIDLNNYSQKKLSSIPEGYILIDTLTNLYVDEQLPPNYKY